MTLSMLSSDLFFVCVVLGAGVTSPCTVFLKCYCTHYHILLYDCLLEGLGWENLETQRQIQKSIMVYKSVNGLAPEYLCSKFSERSCALGYSLRDTTGKLAVPFPRTNYLKNSFSYSGAVTWNSLPLELRQANSLNSFRSGCSEFFSAWS